MSNNFTTKAENALNRSVKVAEELGHTYIGSEHVLIALAEDESSCASMLLRKSKITTEKIKSAVKELSGVGAVSCLTSKDTTPRCRRILESSYKIAKKYSSEKIGTEHILLALLEERESVASKILTKIEADLISLKDEVVTFLRTSERGITYTAPLADSAIPNLMKYGKVITRLAEEGQLDPVIGRDKETERVIRILSRKSKNNPCLIGEAGVGKTAIVEGLAMRIAQGKVPASLLGKTVISLDLTSMVAGAKYRGDFEERIKNIMNEAARNKSVILFIDEIHTIVGAGSAEGAIDAANIMKPELSRGNIQLIGATTLAEYRKYIEKDSALERRFQPVLVEEPDIDGTLEILYGIRERYERHHRIKISDAAIESAVRLSKRYIQDRFLPDKAIDVLDEACAMASVSINLETDKTKNIREKMRQLSNDKKNAILNHDFDTAINLRELEKIYTAELSEEVLLGEQIKGSVLVDEEHVRSVIKEMTGINTKEDISRDFGEIKNRLLAGIIGQDKAVAGLSEAVIRSFAGINEPHRPRGIFLFLGESGVGKTALARELSSVLFNTEDSLVRYDMSEFSESYAVSKLIGSAPGYVGYEDSNSALERIRRHPYSVVLLDEIEKAHPDVLALFLQIFDTGYLRDASGRKINFRNTYIIMTSNIGADKFKDSREVGFMCSGDETPAKRLGSYFKPEFINRIDEVILFSPLEISALARICENKLAELKERISSLGISLDVSADVCRHIATKGKSKGMGARPIGRLITTEIENKIAKMIVDGTLKSGDTVRASIFDDKIHCEKMLMALSSAEE